MEASENTKVQNQNREERTITTTVKELSKSIGCEDTLKVRGLLEGLLYLGIITSPGTAPSKGKKGRASKLYEIPESVELDFSEVIDDIGSENSDNIGSENSDDEVSNT